MPTWVVTKKDGLSHLQLHITKDGKLASVMDCGSRHHYIFGRNSAHCNVVLEHNSISKQHAVLVQGSPEGSTALASIIDLGASNGTYIADTIPTTAEDLAAMRRIDANTPTPITAGMSLRFGESSRIYTLQHEGHERTGAEPAKDMGQVKPHTSYKYHATNIYNILLILQYVLVLHDLFTYICICLHSGEVLRPAFDDHCSDQEESQACWVSHTIQLIQYRKLYTWEKINIFVLFFQHKHYAWYSRT